MEMPMGGGETREETELENLGCDRDSEKDEKAGETGAEESAEAGEVGISRELRSCAELIIIFDRSTKSLGFDMREKRGQ